MPIRRLTRSRSQGVIGGVCAGLANYYGVDVVLVRLLFVILSIAGAVIGGVIVYVAALFIMPEGPDQAAPVANGRVMRRSITDRQIAGVCGGMAEYFEVDPTAVRLLWVILSIFVGAIVGGVIAYLLAWLIIPRASGVSVATTMSASNA
jgi:phage shock protein C